MSTFPVYSNNRFIRGTYGGKLRLGQIAWYEEAPQVGSVTALLGATTLAAADVTVLRSGFTKPDVPRCLVVKPNAATVTGTTVGLEGINSNGQPITESVTTNGTAAVVTTKAFARLTAITLPARSATGNTISIGTANVLGLYHALHGDLRLQTLFDGVADLGTLAQHATDVAKNLFTPAGTLDGTKILRIVYVV